MTEATTHIGLPQLGMPQMLSKTTVGYNTSAHKKWKVFMPPWRMPSSTPNPCCR